MDKKLVAFPNILKESHSLARDKEEALQDLIAKNGENITSDANWEITNQEKFGDSFISLEVDGKYTLMELLERVFSIGGTEGFHATMVLYQYFWNQRKLGQTLDSLDPQHIMDSVLQDKSYKLNPTDKDRFCRIFSRLSDIKILRRDDKETVSKRKKNKISEKESVHQVTRLITYTKIVKNDETGNIVSLENVRFLDGLFPEGMSTEIYKKISRIFVPHETILKLTSDRRKKGKAVFLALICMDLSFISQYGRDTKSYTLEDCLRFGQWKTEPRKKTNHWNRIINILNEAKKEYLLDYQIKYLANKPQTNRYIVNIHIKRLFSVDPKNLSFHFEPEQLDLPIPKPGSGENQNFII